ncbi:MAG: hypothetical protein ABH814_03170 [bacterium]
MEVKVTASTKETTALARRALSGGYKSYYIISLTYSDQRTVLPAVFI